MRENNVFNRLKNAVVTAPVLKTFEPKYPIYVTTDASKDAIGAGLSRIFQTLSILSLFILEP